MKIVKNTLLVIACLFLALLAAAIAYYFCVTADFTLDAKKLEPATHCLTVLNGDDAFVAQMSFSDAQKQIALADLPQHVPAAFIAAEDKNFYKHHGLDYKGMIRAAMKNIQAGHFRQGASTISQQLVKNTQLTPERTIKRKLQEIKLTRQLERKFSKNAILEMYLNTIYFGHSCYGIESAAEFYFGKNASELTPAEAATLAAVIRSPNNYSPFSAPEKCRTIRNAILGQMHKLGYLGGDAFDTAANSELPKQNGNAIASQTYLDAVCREFEQLPVFTPYTNKNYKIFTYLDSRMQEYAENLKTTADRSGKSLLVFDNRTCGVSAFYTTEGEIPRQPGSLFKPLAVYAPAIEEGLLAPCTPILDEKTEFEGYAPSNYKEEYHGYISAREALAKSLNIPAVKVLRTLGTDRAEHYLEKLGLKIGPDDKNLSLALGGTVGEYTLPQLTAAYAAFANSGQFAPPRFIRKIEDEHGTVLYEREATSVQVFGADTAELINDMLACSVTEGTAKKLSLLPFAVCAKTGTCGTEQGNTDAYTIGYTAEHTVAVWMGNADNSRTNIYGGGLPCHYAMLLFKRLYADKLPARLPYGNTDECDIDLADYEKDHIVARAVHGQPRQYIAHEKFKHGALPKQESSVFASPHAEAEISYKNDTITVDLCLTKYYAYSIKMFRNGKIKTTIDEYTKPTYMESKLDPNTQYTYCVTPYYKNENNEKVYGIPLTLPTVHTPANNTRQKDFGEWWKG